MNENKYMILLNVLDKLRNEASEGYKSYYPSEEDIEKLNNARAKAFIHLFLKVKFGLLEFLEREEFITDGPNDGGVDAYYIDRENKIIYIIQAKFRTTEKNFNEKEVTLSDLLKMECDRITSGEKTQENGNEYNSKIKQFQKKLEEIEDIGRYKYKIILLANINSKLKESHLKRIVGGFPYEVYDARRTYDDLLFPLVSGTFYNASEIFVELNLSNKNSNPEISYTVDTQFGTCEITTVFVPTIEIAKVIYKYKNSILKFNPRSYLELKNNINKEIKNTIENKNTNEFALFNNGITIISDGTALNKRIGKKDSAQLVIKNPQIINGGQTSYTLSEIYEERLISKDFSVFDNKEVWVKIITFTDQDNINDNDKLQLIEEISKATNQQSPVLEEDRRSNEKVQIELQHKIYDTFGYFYERKKGEFADGIKYKYIDRSKLIDRVLLLRLILAINLNPRDARSKSKKLLFSKGHFEKILVHPDNEYLC